MARRRIDDETMARMLTQERLSQADVARHFGVSEAAVSKAVRRLNRDMPRHVGLERAKAVADRSLNVVDQLAYINHVICEELDWAIAESRKPDASRRTFAETIMNLTGEVRKQLALQVDIVRALYDVQGAAEFQREVLNAIAEASPAIRQEILRRLAEKRALRSATQFTPVGA
jgi:predicted transcriptional regulator